MKKQVYVIPFKRDFLLEYNDIQQTSLEIIESIDDENTRKWWKS